ncbi:hypothetical protein CATRI_06575 [Corynebacterium atrinae]|uniref:hypothetical protein n=1 Tax=Corynebacterium atrinae TaxID=1336740 RepID=UPI0025B44B14|nr:hypothetical protein [Corynebacterium atrinae]WJY63397.1 hypothetical protein CATRI_06575 [Corynebacterium atrinae]
MGRLIHDHGGLTIALTALLTTLVARIIIDLLVAWPTPVDWAVSIAVAAIVSIVVARKIPKIPQ